MVVETAYIPSPIDTARYLVRDQHGVCRVGIVMGGNVASIRGVLLPGEVSDEARQSAARTAGWELEMTGRYYGRFRPLERLAGHVKASFAPADPIPRGATQEAEALRAEIYRIVARRVLEEMKYIEAGSPYTHQWFLVEHIEREHLHVHIVAGQASICREHCVSDSFAHQLAEIAKSKLELELSALLGKRQERPARRMGAAGMTSRAEAPPQPLILTGVNSPDASPHQQLIRDLRRDVVPLLETKVYTQPQEHTSVKAGPCYGLVRRNDDAA